MSENIESLDISGILPSNDVSNEQLSSPDSSDSDSEYEQSNLRDGNEIYNSEGVSNHNFGGRNQHRSIHAQRTENSTVEATVIPTTYTSFQLSVSVVAAYLLMVSCNNPQYAVHIVWQCKLCPSLSCQTGQTPQINIQPSLSLA